MLQNKYDSSVRTLPMDNDVPTNTSSKTQSEPARSPAGTAGLCRGVAELQMVSPLYRALRVVDFCGSNQAGVLLISQ
jgi:hypothetical protein